MHLTKFHC